MRSILATLHSKYVHASLALPYLAAACAEGCGEIDIAEFTVHEPKEQILAALLLERPDVVAFSVYLWNRRETLDLVDALHAARPALRIVLGGPELSFADERLFERHPGLTALVRGEGEIPFSRLLAGWALGDTVVPPGTLVRTASGIVAGRSAEPPADLDQLASPFAAGRVDLNRGLVYYESSRGCPYACAFCMSARDAAVRSFSIARIRADLQILLDAEVPLIKFVDRTFNYDRSRALAIWSFLLEKNRCSRFHFEIGAHLLDDATLDVLATVPADLFQFEIGVQSTLPQTLAAINRSADLDRLEANVWRLRRDCRVPLHLDLIYGLPEEGFDSVLASLDRVAALQPDHLQLEPVKLLPGAPLRDAAERFGIVYDPHPPYSVLGTPLLDFADLERLRGLSRLLDLLVNSHRFSHLLTGLSEKHGALSAALLAIEAWWRREGLFRRPLGQREIFLQLGRYLLERAAAPLLLEALARDLLLCERVTPETAPEWVDLQLQPDEAAAVRAHLSAATAAIRGQGVKLQHAAALFHGSGTRILRLYLYRTASGAGQSVEEIELSPAADLLC